MVFPGTVLRHPATHTRRGRPDAYRTPALDFLEPPDAFLAMFDDVHRAESSEWTVPDQRAPGTQIVVLQPPAA